MVFPKGRTRLYVRDISEPDDNVLRVVVEQANGRGPVEDSIVGSVGEIVPGPEDRVFEFVWSRYVAYAVINESYARLEDGESPYEDTFRERTDSAFLRYVAASTFADEDYPGPLRHWALGSLNHCIDVVAVNPPEIRVLSSQGHTANG